MASSHKLITSIFLLTLLFLQIHARESHFFSKMPNNNNNNNNGEAEIPNKLDNPLTNPEKTTTPQDQQPNFIPQTQDNGYGLYGHESGQFPPSDDDNNNNNNNNNHVVPYKSQSEDQYYNNNNFFENTNSKKQYENSFYYNNKNLYDNGRQSFRNTRLSRDDYTTTAAATTTTPSYDKEEYNNFYNKNNGRDNANNVVRQGMSDTRFMENGKYFYDLDMEPHHYSRSRGNFGNNNNNNEYGNNSMGRYQNDDDAEFEEEPDEFVP